MESLRSLQSTHTRSLSRYHKHFLGLGNNQSKVRLDELKRSLGSTDEVIQEPSEESQ